VRTLQEWQALHERVTVHRRAGLLQAADGQLLSQLLDQPPVREHLIRPVADGQDGEATLAVISPALGQVEGLARTLERLGYPALRTRSSKDPLSPILRLDEAKLTPSGIPVEFIVALPSIYLLKEIQPFASSDERGQLYLTPSSIQNAIDQGLPIQEMLARLRALHRGSLPHSVEQQIRAWGHYYGDAAMERVTLIEIRDADTLNELLGEPEVRALMRPFVPNPDSALARVDPERLQELLSVLARYGIQVQEGLGQASLQPRSDVSSTGPEAPT
jgi:hypothetical protein